jgi:hypothetical protein
MVVPILSLIWSAALLRMHGELREEAGVARANATCQALMHHVELLFPFAKVGLFLVVCDMYPCNRYFLNSASPFSFGSSGFRNQLEAVAALPGGRGGSVDPAHLVRKNDPHQSDIFLGPKFCEKS